MLLEARDEPGKRVSKIGISWKDASPIGIWAVLDGGIVASFIVIAPGIAKLMQNARGRGNLGLRDKMEKKNLSSKERQWHSYTFGR